jgi:hypothetical protein
MGLNRAVYGATSAVLFTSYFVIQLRVLLPTGANRAIGIGCHFHHFALLFVFLG